MGSLTSDRRHLRDRIRSTSESESSTFSGNSGASSANHEPQSTRRPLNNARTDVISTIETLPDYTVKYLFRVIYISIILAVMGVTALMVVKLNNASQLRSNSVLIWNAGVASSGILALGICFGCYLKRLYLVFSQRMNWSDRRRKGAILFNIELVTQLVNLSFFLAPNVYLLIRECGWHDMFITWAGFGRMTCWNTLFFLFLIMSSNFNLIKDTSRNRDQRRADMAVFDKPLSHHAPKIFLWVVTESLFLAIALYMQTHQSYDLDDAEPCTGEEFSCNMQDVVKHMTFGVALVFILYFLGTIYYFRKGFQDLSEKQYLNYRMSNIMIRLQLRLQMIVHCFHIVSFALLWFVNMDSCASFVLSWLGFLPSQFAMTIIVCVKCYLFIPLKPTKEDFTLQMWLREYSWSEEELPSMIAQRGNGCCTQTAPMFCFERAVKTLYWSSFIYYYKEIPDSKFSLKVAMHLYDLTEYELFHERQHDTKLMVAWNQKMALLAFRGTSSLKNVFADLRIARIPHPPIRGGFMTQPMVHRGFLQTWTSNGLNQRVMELLQTIMKDKKEFTVLLTGHSLGGALATLAAYDIRHELKMSPCSVVCYTFGAPRVGNYAFAHDYNRMVPNTWNIINDQDYITRTMKLLVLYKRPGQRVIVNSQGDMLVRPSFIEMSLSRKTGAVNILHHFLGSYERAFLAIARTQFSEDSIEGGYEGMLRISNTLKHVLGVSRARLIQELSWGNRIRELEKKKRREQSTLLSVFSSTKQMGHHVLDCFTRQWERISRFLTGPQKTTQMNGIDIDTTRVCGGKMCQVIEMKLQEEGGLSFETGHLSLESQRTESERFHTELDSVQEEVDVTTMV